MKEAIAKEWTKRLRSGDYAQTTGSLCRTPESATPFRASGYCCLGVLAELAVEAGVCDKWINPHGEAVFGKRRGDQSTGLLPKCVIRWAGFKKDNTSGLMNVPAEMYWPHDVPASQRGELIETALTNLNDSRGHNFEQIANAIDAAWEQL